MTIIYEGSTRGALSASYTDNPIVPNLFTKYWHKIIHFGMILKEKYLHPNADYKDHSNVDDSKSILFSSKYWWSNSSN